MHILAHFRSLDREEESVALSRPSPPSATAPTETVDGREEGEASASDEDTMEMEGGGEESSCPSRARYGWMDTLDYGKFTVVGIFLGRIQECTEYELWYSLQYGRRRTSNSRRRRGRNRSSSGWEQRRIGMQSMQCSPFPDCRCIAEPLDDIARRIETSCMHGEYGRSGKSMIVIDPPLQTCDASFTQKDQLEYHISTTHRKWSHQIDWLFRVTNL